MKLTLLQRRMWWLNELNPKPTGFNIPLLLESSTEPSSDWLDLLSNTIENLNISNYTLTDETCLEWREVLPNKFIIDRVVNDSDKLILDCLARHHFDLRNEPPLKVTLVNAGAKIYLLFLFCHIVFDGSAAALFINSLTKKTKGETNYLTKTQSDNIKLPSINRNSLNLWIEQLKNLELGLLSDLKKKTMK